MNCAVIWSRAGTLRAREEQAMITNMVGGLKVVIHGHVRRGYMLNAVRLSYALTFLSSIILEESTGCPRTVHRRCVPRFEV